MPLSFEDEERMEDATAGIEGAYGDEGDAVLSDPGFSSRNGPHPSPHGGGKFLAPPSEKIRVVVMAGGAGDWQSQGSSVGKALIVNTGGTWTDFLEVALPLARPFFRRKKCAPATLGVARNAAKLKLPPRTGRGAWLPKGTAASPRRLAAKRRGCVTLALHRKNPMSN